MRRVTELSAFDLGDSFENPGILLSRLDYLVRLADENSVTFERFY